MEVIDILKNVVGTFKEIKDIYDYDSISVNVSGTMAPALSMMTIHGEEVRVRLTYEMIHNLDKNIDTDIVNYIKEQLITGYNVSTHVVRHNKINDLLDE